MNTVETEKNHHHLPLLVVAAAAGAVVAKFMPDIVSAIDESGFFDNPTVY